MKTRYFIALIIPALVVLASCNELLLGPDQEPNNVECFEILWKDYDELYSRFEYKQIDWDSLHNHYKFLVNNSQPGQELFGIFSSLLNNLKDSHATLGTPYGTFAYNRGHEKPAFSINLIKEKYLSETQSYAGLTFGKLNGNIGYVHINSFGNSNSDAYKYIDNIISSLADIKGLVIDVRNNGGGNTSNAETIAGRFVSSSKIYAYAKYKNGPSHNDFTGLSSWTVKPGGNNFSKPVIVLTNRRSASATEDFIMMMKVTENTTVVGDTSAGAIGGHPVTRELPNGWIYRIPTAVMFNTNYEIVGDVGIAPDIYIKYTDADRISNKDTILEYVLKLLN